MSNSKENRHEIIYTFSKEKLDEFKNTPINARLKWLEYANSFINNAIGIEKRSLLDKRFYALRVAIFRDLDDTFYDDDWRLHIQACYNYVRAIIFDLDDTLYDCSGTLVLQGRKHAAKTITRLINCSEEEAYLLQLEMEEKYGVKANIYEKIATLYSLPDIYAQELLEEFVHIDISGITVFPDVINTLIQLKTRGYKLFLITSGDKQIQGKKIEVLGLNKGYFDDIMITERNKGQSKKTCFQEIIKRYDLQPEEVICVGDKMDDELTAGKSLGMITVMVEHGRHYKAYLKERDKYVKPDYSIKCFEDLLKLGCLEYFNS